MSKQLIIALTTTVIGVFTIVVGLYILSQTPAPANFNADPSVQRTADKADYMIPSLPQSESATGDTTLIEDAATGSELWCEAMMQLPDAQWQTADAKLFAQHCIYPTP
ncbi:DUF3012 domain-containing protein [Gilvimarinus sp. 1_MG-2023]|uniref:DUF3012 domain-containing protein n=1 Tax=Gilvimarinus sp. 1_MG-2023 TaxID=3062638 RepID=UPI0026E378E7|nr:DUF3012 domain-containing protein [Gilvimarinus sp. 1_MG-2023]MDO6745847.1 DUF3012 domain-containing protein [Gilvimarinus sp. 1_MG-2023]